MVIIQPVGMGYYSYNNEIDLLLQFPLSGGVQYEVQESTDNVNWTTTQFVKFNGNRTNQRAFPISLTDGVLVRVISA